MTRELAKKCDEYWKKNTPWWDQVDSMESDTFNHSAKEVHDEFVSYFGDDLDDDLETELRIEAYKEAIKADSTYFDCADTGYRPDDMVEGWGDIYFGKGIFLKELYGYEDATEDEIKAVFGDVFSLEDDSYYLADCRRDPSTYYKVER